VDDLNLSLDEYDFILSAFKPNYMRVSYMYAMLIVLGITSIQFVQN
jgi:hypothetical protein